MFRWFGNYSICGHCVAAYVKDEAVDEWADNEAYYLAIAGKALDVSPVYRPNYRASGIIAGMDAKLFNVYPVQGVDGIGMLYYTDQRTSRYGLYVVECEYRAIVFPCGIRLIEETAGDGLHMEQN